MRRSDHRVLVLLVVGVAAVVLLTPARLLWGGVGTPWWLPFVAWGGLVALGGCVLLATPRDD